MCDYTSAPKPQPRFRNEGFRPIGKREYGSHCPVPVYLLFDSVSVLSRLDSRFTDGNLASGTNIRGSIEELRQVPFELVYHDTSLNPDERGRIIYHRNAEVLIPQRMGLETVQRILCRSQAEYETLLHLLPSGARSRWVGRIGVQANLFFGRWAFVQQVEMTGQRLLFRFNNETETPGPFDAQVDIFEPLTGGSKKRQWREGQFEAADVLDFNLRNLTTPWDYTVRFSLDGELAFANRYQDDDLPF